MINKKELLLSLINEIVKDKISEITEDQLLVDIGLNSLDVVELQMNYEEITGIEINTTSPISTVKDLLELMA